MIDMHCHIVPGVDDGSQNLEDSLQMVAAEVSGGTQAFITTPHVIEKVDYDRLPFFAEQLESLREALKAAGQSANLYSGGEIYPSHHMVEAVDKGLPVTLANTGRYMLVDLPMGLLPHDFGDLLWELQVRKITPIVAHPERCASFQMEPETLEPYLDKGIAFQVNAGSIAGKYGPRASEVAWMYLRKHWAQFLGSDLHRPPRRPNLAFARETVLPHLDEDYVDILVRRSAQAILDGGPLPERPKPKAVVKPEAKQGWFKKILGR